MKRKIVPRQEFKTVCAYPLISGDVRAYEIELDLGSDINAEFKVVAIRPDGKVIEDLGKVEKGIATYTLSSSMYDIEGELVLRLQILESGSILTDREIIFDVEKGANGSAPLGDVVPLNDSVILRMSDLEGKLVGKVDKVSGKGLSANDFSDEYKAKLDNLDETIGKEVERIAEQADNLLEELSDHKDNINNPHNVTAEDVGTYSTEEIDGKLTKKAERADVYTKTEIAEYLSKKANKSDISNVYRYCGSKETFEDLIVERAIKLVPNGVPTVNGEVCGTYNRYNNSVTVNTIGHYNWNEIEIPVNEVTLEAGYYAIQSDLFNGLAICSGVSIEPLGLSATEAEYQNNCVFKIDEPVTISVGKIFKFYDDYYFEGASGDSVCTLYKIQKKYVNEKGSDMSTMTQSCPVYLSGDVYNVLADDMNYAWTGTEWDALGGEHKDLEAREQIGNIETALDEIINIQNSLIGGESV